MTTEMPSLVFVDDSKGRPRPQRPAIELSGQEFPRTYQTTARVLAYLLRATCLRAGDLGAHRTSNLSRELSDSLFPLVVAERNLAGAYRTLCQRFSVDATGADSEYGAIELWMPEGRIRWDRAIAALDSRLVRLVAHDLSDLLATFAVSYASEYDEASFLGLTLAEGATPWIPTLPDRRLSPRAWRAVWTLTAPMAHGHDAKYGNVSMFRRQREINPFRGESVDVPFMAGNAVRGLFRRLVMGRYLSLLGLRLEDLPPSRAHALISGGNVEAGADSGGVLNTVRRQARAMCPPWDLLAGCIEQQVMQGRLRVHDAVLVCRETAWKTHHLVAPHMAFEAYEASLPLAAEMTTLRLGTRQRDRDLEGGEGIQMLWNTEVLQSGAQMVHTFAPFGLQGVSEVTLSCLADLLGEFQDASAVGASCSRGYGMIAFDPYRPGEGVPELPSPTIYREYVAANREAMRAWAAPPKVEATQGGAVIFDKPGAGKKGRGKKDAAPLAPLSPLASPGEIDFDDASQGSLL